MKAYHFRESVTAWCTVWSAKSFAQVKCSRECASLKLVASPPGLSYLKALRTDQCFKYGASTFLPALTSAAPEIQNVRL